MAGVGVGMRIIVSGGGTGGHVYPVLAVLNALRQLVEAGREELDALYVGGGGSIEAELSAREEIAFEAIAGGGLRGLSMGTVLRNGLSLVRGLLQSARIVRRFGPDVVFATGGYVCAPVVTAAWMSGCPTIVYLPDIEPGLAVKALSRVVDRVAVSFAVSRRHLPVKKVVVTGYPVRRSLRFGERAAARERLGLASDGFVLLVLGGSRGAHSINVAVAGIVPSLVEGCEIIHVCGRADLDWLKDLRGGLPVSQRGRYQVHDYLHQEVADAMVAADLVVARAGAATMGEFPAARLPSILVPYPFSGHHQDPNADYMVAQGAAMKLDNEELADRLESVIRELMSDPQRLARMAERARSMFVPDAAERAAREIVRLASGQ